MTTDNVGHRAEIILYQDGGKFECGAILNFSFLSFKSSITAVLNMKKCNILDAISHELDGGLSQS
jgi:hypothetical protein